MSQVVAVSLARLWNEKWDQSELTSLAEGIADDAFTTVRPYFLLFMYYLSVNERVRRSVNERGVSHLGNVIRY